MALQSGNRIGAYEIVERIGAGGMGGVYRARDLRLKREVALKILPESFAADPERLARFQREAEVLASLNHPNIAAIHGLEELNGTRALVMELVGGPTLSERIAQGPIPIDETLPIARQIAEALEAAHEQGIIHRDLKPANIKVKPDGTVKVLDFGLAKALEPASAAGVDATASPTITSPAMMTGVGALLGTAAYMSPEQAKGRPADRRADVWAFGCVLYEMLTGKRAFEAEDVSDTLAAVLRGEPSWRALAVDVPPSIRTLIQGCLRKDRQQRIGHVSTAQFLLAEAVSLAPLPPTKSRGRRGLLIAGTAVTFGLAGAGALWILQTPAPEAVTRFSIGLADAQRFPDSQNNISVSPDGSRLAYVVTSTSDGSRDSELFLRAMADLEPRSLGGREKLGLVVGMPFFSPDGEWVGFWSDSAIKKVAVGGGAVLTICEADPLQGVSWDGNSIVFGQGNKGIMRVSADGGSPEVVAQVNASEFAHGPQLVNNGQALLFTVVTGGLAPDRWDNASIVLQSLETGERKVIVRGGVLARYLPTGHLLYALGDNLLAVAFDAASGELRGAPVTVLEGVQRSTRGALVTGGAHVAVSTSGTLAYVPGSLTNGTNARTIVLVDWTGASRPLPLPARPYSHPRVAPDGRRLAVAIDDGREASIWVVDDFQSRASPRQLTFGGRNHYPIWSHDGLRVTYQSDRDGDLGLFEQPADGSRPAQRLTKADRGTAHIPNAWSPDGQTLVFHVSATPQPAALWAFAAQADKTPRRLTTPRDSFGAFNAVFSPDGHWLAYSVSSVAGGGAPPAVFVEPFPPMGALYRVASGVNPSWSRIAGTMFYEFGGNTVFAVEPQMTPAPTFRPVATIPVGAAARVTFLEGF